VQLTAGLTHPSTIAIYDYGRTADGVFYYAMELLRGINLGQLIELEGAIAPARVVHLVRQHMFDYRHEWTDAAVRRFVRSVGPDQIADLFDLRIADNIGNGTKVGFPHYLEEFRTRIEGVLEAQEALTIRDLAVGGADVMAELGLTAGPRVGEILSQLLEEVLEDPALNDRERLLRRVREAFSIDRSGSDA
jgi:hypothetical protein